MLVEMLLDARRNHGSRLAVSDGTKELTYAQLTSASLAIRHFVRQKDDPKIGLMLPASTAFPAALFGVLWAKRAAVPLNFLLSPPELKDIIADAGLSRLFTIRAFEGLASQLPIEAIYLEDLPLKRRAMLTVMAPTPDPPSVKEDDTAVLLYTSGTSGKPKGVPLSYLNLKSNCDGSIEAAQMEPGHKFLNMLPPFHVFGLTANVLCPIALGASVYAIPRFNPSAALRTIEAESISIILAIPSMFGAMCRLKSARREMMRSVYIALSGGEPLADVVADGFEETFGIRLLQGYGLTETSPVISLCAPHACKDGSVGRPIPGVELAILDEDGNSMSPSAQGEICVRGPGVMIGYYDQPELTRAVIDGEGWFHTGDIGMVDEEGYLFITGRKKDMMIVGGENVFPFEIESVLLRHEAIHETAVIGTNDKSRGEVPIAFVILKEGTSATDQEIRQFAKEHLAGYKVPRQVHIVDDLPRGPTGKILKRELQVPPS